MASFQLGEYSVTEYRSSNFLCSNIYFWAFFKVLFLGTSSRGLTFEKTGEEKVYYIGPVSKGDHDMRYYRDIAREIVRCKIDGIWSNEVQVDIGRKGKDGATWEKVQQKDFLPKLRNDNVNLP